MGKRFYLASASGFAALGGLLFGYDTGVISGAILFIRKEFALSTFSIEIVVSAVLLGAILGACCAGVLSDYLGRKKLLLGTALLFILGSLGSALAGSPAWLIFNRILVGAAIGMSSMTAPLYLAEISPASIRGMLVSLNQLAITIGIVLAYLVDYSLAPIEAWRWMLGLGALPAIIFGLGMAFLPESPRWLFKKGFIEQSRQALIFIHGQENAILEMEDIQNYTKSPPVSLFQAMTPWLKRALLIGIGLAIFQQLTGINTIIYYAPMIFELAGFTAASDAILATGLIGMANVLSTCIALWLLDKAGRRILLLAGLAGMIFSLGCLGAFFSLPHLSHYLGALTLSMLMLYVISFSISLGPIFWLLIAEIYPLYIRGTAMSVAAFANWFANLAIALTFLSLIKLLGIAATFWLYGVIGILAWIFSYFLVPETKNLSLEAIEAAWNHPNKE